MFSKENTYECMPAFGDQINVDCSPAICTQVSQITQLRARLLTTSMLTWTRSPLNTRSFMPHKATCTPTADNTLLRASERCTVTSFRTSCSTGVMNFISRTWWCWGFCSRLSWTQTEYNIQIHGTDTWTILNLHIEELTPPKKKVDISHTVNKGVKHPPKVFTEIGDLLDYFATSITSVVRFVSWALLTLWWPSTCNHLHSNVVSSSFPVFFLIAATLLVAQFTPPPPPAPPPTISCYAIQSLYWE